MRRIGFALLLSLTGAALAVGAVDNRFVVKIGQYGPRTEVRFARPTLQWQVWAADQTSKVSSVLLKLDGKRVEAEYDERARAVKYTPTSPLSPGVHRVECRITFAGGAYFDKNWETRIAASPIAEFPAASTEQVSAVTSTNDLRRAIGLDPVKVDDRLNLAALLHSQYLASNNMTGHGEKPGTPGFVGESGADRLEAYGWIGSSWEDVNFGSRSVPESIQDLFHAPYHRIPFMQPGTISFGAGYADQRTTLEFSATDDEGTVVSPADGQSGVPTAWHNFERPNPLRMYGANTRETGYPIVLAHFAPSLPRLRNVQASLTTAAGDSVACWLNTPDNDETLTCAAILIPQSPLRPGTRYQATFTGSDDEGHVIDRRVVFTTAATVKRNKASGK